MKQQDIHDIIYSDPIILRLRAQIAAREGAILRKLADKATPVTPPAYDGPVPAVEPEPKPEPTKPEPKPEPKPDPETTVDEPDLTIVDMQQIAAKATTRVARARGVPAVEVATEVAALIQKHTPTGKGMLKDVPKEKRPALAKALEAFKD